MTTLSDLLATPVMQTLGLTLVHFLWQGTLVALVIAILLYVLKDSSPSIRYLVSCAGLAVMTLLPFATFAYLAPTVQPVYQFTDTSRAALQPANIQPSANATTQTANQQVSDTSATTTELKTPAQNTSSTRTIFSPRTFKIYLPWLVALWLAGVLVLSARLMGGLWLARQLRTKATKPVAELLESKLRDLASKLNISKNVRLRESLALKVPVVIGWLRPVILLPSSAITGLSVKQLELILAHELAHIHRHDYLVNLLQKIAETLLFYHPAVWWLSGAIRQERENCCDDVAITLCEGDRLLYAKTLSLLDGMRPSNAIALAADGGSLLRRIQRMAGKPVNTNYPAQWFVGVFMLLVPWAVLSVATAQAKLPTEIAENIDAFVESRLEAWNVPGIQVAIIQDGEVTFNKAYGLADVENNRVMTVNTPIQLGSGSWLIHAIAAMQLVDQGKLKLTDKISDHLPWVKFRDGEEAKITMRNLIANDADIADSIRIPGAQMFNYDDTSALDESTQSPEDYIRSLMPDKLYTRYPNEGDDDYAYVNNDVLLMLILEKVAGIPLEQYVQDKIFSSLQLKSTYDLDKAKNQGLAVGYKSSKEDDIIERFPREMIASPFIPPSALQVPLSLSMSSQDFAKVLTAIVKEDSRLLSKQGWTNLKALRHSLWGAGGWWGDSSLLANLGTTESSQVFFEVRPSQNIAYITMANYILPTDANPLYQVLGSISQSLMLFNDSSVFYRFDDTYRSLPANPSSFTIERLEGKYISAIGPIELFAKNDEFRGTILGREFKLEGYTTHYIIRSEFELIDGLEMEHNGRTIRLDGRQFAYKVN